MYLNFDLVEDLSIVNTNHGTDHFGNDNHITEMGLDDFRLLILGTCKLSLAKALNKGERLALKTTVEASTGTAMNKINELRKILQI